MGYRKFRGNRTMGDHDSYDNVAPYVPPAPVATTGNDRAYYQSIASADAGAAASATASAASAAGWASQAQQSAVAALASLNQLKAKILLGSVSADTTAQLGARYNVPIHNIQGFILPADPASYKAGITAMANQLALDLQAGHITKAKYDQAIAALGQV